MSQNCSYIYSSNIELRNFPDKESHIFMHRLEESRGKNVQILHRCEHLARQLDREFLTQRLFQHVA